MPRPTQAFRACVRDKLGFSCNDVGDGWLIFNLPEAELCCHPTGNESHLPSGTHQFAVYCDDLDQTMAELRGRGVVFDEEVKDLGWSHATHFTMPGEVRVQLYQPRYAKESDY